MGVDRDSDLSRKNQIEVSSTHLGGTFYMELVGGEPLVPEERAIVIRGKIVGRSDLGVIPKTVTIEILLDNLSGVSESPYTRAQIREAQELEGS